MINLDVDLIYLTRNYDINLSKFVNAGTNESISELMEEESQAGNVEATNFSQDVLNDKEELLEAFKLSDPVNRYLILSNLSSDDLQFFLQKMSAKDLAVGLKFFCKEKILELLSQLPQEELFKLLKSVFSTDEMVKLIPDEELDKFLLSDKLKNEDILQYLEFLPEEALVQLMANLTSNNDDTKKSNLQSISGYSSNNFKRALTSLDQNYKEDLISSMLRSDEKFIKNFSGEALVSPLEKLKKEEITHAVGETIQPEHLLKLLDELPQEFLAMVTTQLDPNIFSDILVNRFQDVITQIGC